jgi:transposase InsO family protein
MRNPTDYLKMRVLGAIDMAEGNTQRERIRAVAALPFTDEDGIARQFTWRTIETWLMRYNKHGLTALTPQGRSDKGKLRKVCLEEVMEAVRTVLPAFHSATPKKQALYRACIEQGLLQRDRVAPNTFSRIVTAHEMLKADGEARDKRRLAFAKAHANEMWQGDTMFGPYVREGASPVQSKLIAFIDDASRVCVHGAFFAREDVDSLIEALSSAFYKRGVPEAMYVDNGSIYTSKEIVQICGRLGCILTHTPVRDGAAKGKIERFFRTVREQFLCRQLDLSGLEVLNRQFTAWVEEHYNATKHSVLGMSPLDRFALDRRRIRYLPPNEVNEELFFVEEDRVVKTDNTFPFKNVRYEAPRHLPNRTVQVRYQRWQPNKRVVVYYKSERMGEARALDPVANDRPPTTGQASRKSNHKKKEQ